MKNPRYCIFALPNCEKCKQKYGEISPCIQNQTDYLLLKKEGWKK